MKIINSNFRGSNRSPIATRSLRDAGRGRMKKQRVTQGLAEIGHALSHEFRDLAYQYAVAPNTASRRLALQHCIAHAVKSPNALRHLNKMQPADIKSALAYVGVSSGSRFGHSSLAAILVVALAALLQAPVADVSFMGIIEDGVQLSVEALEALGASAGTTTVEAVEVIEVAESGGLLAEALAALSALAAGIASLPPAMAFGVVVFVGVVGVIAVRHIMGY